MTHSIAILFDLDGTLVDTAPDFVKAANALRKEHGLPKLPKEEIMMQVSNGSIAVTRTCMAINENDPEFPGLRDRLLEHYATYLGSASTIYPTLNTLLAELTGLLIPWGIVTNKPLRFAQPLIEKLGLTASCGTLICPEHVKKTKPDPESLRLAAVTLEIPAENCIYIGDHPRDIEAGNSAGMTTIAAGYGYIETHQNINNWPCDHTVNSSKELYDRVHQLIPHA